MGGRRRVSWEAGQAGQAAQTRGTPSCPAPTAQPFPGKDGNPFFRLYVPQTSDSLGSRPAAEVGKPHLPGVGKTTAQSRCPLSAPREVSLETKLRGHGFGGVGSGVRELTSGEGVNSVHLGASGWKAGSPRQGELCGGAREQMPSGPLGVPWAGGKAPLTECKATVDLEVGRLTWCLSPRRATALATVPSSSPNASCVGRVSVLAG